MKLSEGVKGGVGEWGGREGQRGRGYEGEGLNPYIKSGEPYIILYPFRYALPAAIPLKLDSNTEFIFCDKIQTQNMS